MWSQHQGIQACRYMQDEVVNPGLVDAIILSIICLCVSNDDYNVCVCVRIHEVDIASTHIEGVKCLHIQ